MNSVIKRGGNLLATLRFALGTAAEKRSFLENKQELKSFFNIAIARLSAGFACATGGAVRAADET